MKAAILAILFCCSTVQAQVFKNHADCMKNSKMSSEGCKQFLELPALPPPEAVIMRQAPNLTSMPIWADYDECMSRSKLSSPQCEALYKKPRASAIAPVISEPAFQSFKECMERSKLSQKECRAFDKKAESLRDSLSRISLDNPDASCPECGADKDTLVRLSIQSKKDRDAKFEQISKLVRSAGTKDKLTDTQLANIAALNAEAQTLEINRLKMNNRVSEIEIQNCGGATSKAGATTNTNR